MPSPNGGTSGSTILGIGSQASTFIGAVAGCNLTISYLDASLGSASATVNELGFIRIGDVASSGSCSSGTLVLWEDTLGVGPNRPADHIVAGNDGNVAVAQTGDAICVEFTGAISNAYEKFNVTYYYQ